MVVQRVSTVLWETIGKIWETVSVPQKVLKTTDLDICKWCLEGKSVGAEVYLVNFGWFLCSSAGPQCGKIFLIAFETTNSRQSWPTHANCQLARSFALLKEVTHHHSFVAIEIPVVKIEWFARSMPSSPLQTKAVSIKLMTNWQRNGIWILRISLFPSLAERRTSNWNHNLKKRSEKAWWRLRRQQVRKIDKMGCEQYFLLKITDFVWMVNLERLHGSRLPGSNEFTHVKLCKRASARFQLFSSFIFCVTCK